ncbi:MAG: hypothetical protein WCI04_04375 [archaeon]
MKPKHTRIRRVVHLGNLGEGTPILSAPKPKIKTEKYARRFRKTHFIGIDIEHDGFRRRNWTQIKGDFLEGIKKLKDNSVDLLSSELSFGHYDPNGIEHTELSKTHTLNTIQIVYKKLRPNGKLIVVVSKNVLPNFINAINKTGFSKEKIQVSEVSFAQRTRTPWTDAFYKNAWQIIAVK